MSRGNTQRLCGLQSLRVKFPDACFVSSSPSVRMFGLGLIPRSLLRREPLSSTWYKIYNSYKCFIRVMKCIGAGFASYKGEKASSTTEYASLGLGGLSLIGVLHRYASDRTIWLVVAGVAAAIVGLGLLLRRTASNTVMAPHHAAPARVHHVQGIRLKQCVAEVLFGTTQGCVWQTGVRQSSHAQRLSSPLSGGPPSRGAACRLEPRGGSMTRAGMTARGRLYRAVSRTRRPRRRACSPNDPPGDVSPYTVGAGAAQRGLFGRGFRRTGGGTRDVATRWKRSTTEGTDAWHRVLI